MHPYYAGDFLKERSRRRNDPAVAGRIELCDRCGNPHRTFRQRPQEFVCGPCTSPDGFSYAPDR
jgi:hypothetical protein